MHLLSFITNFLPLQIYLLISATMASPKPTWFDSAQIKNFHPPVYVPDTPAPSWVRNAIGSRQITPSAALFLDRDCLNEAKSEVEDAHNNNEQVSRLSFIFVTLCVVTTVWWSLPTQLI